MCATGAEALRGAVYALAAGAYDIALALGVEKLKDPGWSGAPDASVIGLRMMYEVYKQLQKKVRPRQIKNPRLGLKHAVRGVIGATIVSCIVVGN
jgi:acetyl-CoA acetyltransferase